MILERKKCEVCSNNNLEHLHTFKAFPVYMGISKESNSSRDLFADMTWQICKDCGFIQLKNLIDLDVLYQRPHNPAIGKTWELHHNDFSNFVKENSGKHILEIGGGNLSLQKRLIDWEFLESYTIFDKHQYDESNLNSKKLFVNEIFNLKSIIENKIDTIINSHTFEHFYEPVAYLKKFHSILPKNGKLIMSFPNIENVIKDGINNGLNFEHTFLLNKKIIKEMLKLVGFCKIKIVDYNRYNLFVCCQKKSKIGYFVINNDYERNKKLFDSYILKNKKELLKISKKISTNKGKNYIFGGHVFTQFLISFGLNENKIESILDNDPNKIGNRLYGTNLMINSPQILKNEKDACVILKAGIYSKEIAEQIKNINQSVKIIL